MEHKYLNRIGPFGTLGIAILLLGGLVFLNPLTLNASEIEPSSHPKSYTISAYFNDIAQLRTQAKVSMNGMTIGYVVGIKKDSALNEAIVDLKIYGPVGSMSIDTGAQVLSDGFFSPLYIDILPGAEEEVLRDGDIIEDTQGAISVKNLARSLLFAAGAP